MTGRAKTAEKRKVCGEHGKAGNDKSEFIRWGGELKMQFENFLKKLHDDEEFICYYPIKPIYIFGCKLDNCECEINVSKRLSAEQIVPLLKDYLKWLSFCEDEVRSYFTSKLGENLPSDWFEHIEVYRTDITFVTPEDFGATISFGESIFSSHTIELYFEKYQIVDDILNG